MVTLTTPLDLTQLDEELFPTRGGLLYHGAHLDCQLENDQVITVCGLLCSWSDLKDSSKLPRCPTCSTDPVTCPVCGAKLIPGN